MKGYAPYPGKGTGGPPVGLGKGPASKGPWGPDPWGMPGKGQYVGKGGTVRLEKGAEKGWKGEALAPGPVIGGKGGKPVQPCKYFEMGTCVKGANCAFPHVVPLPGPAASAGKGGWAFKTKLCKFFEMGTCVHGPGCEFAHGVHELGGGKGPAKGQWQPQPIGYAANGVPPTPGAMTKMCKFWMAGSCPQGRSCTFAHSEHELQSAQGAGKSKGKGKRNIKTMMCQNWEQTGTCPRASEDCMFAHGPEELQEYVASEREVQFAKTKMCKFFEAGTCSRGEDCLYAHGEHELLPMQFDGPQATVYDHSAGAIGS